MAQIVAMLCMLMWAFLCAMVSSLVDDYSDSAYFTWWNNRDAISVYSVGYIIVAVIWRSLVTKLELIWIFDDICVLSDYRLSTRRTFGSIWSAIMLVLAVFSARFVALICMWLRTPRPTAAPVLSSLTFYRHSSALFVVFDRRLPWSSFRSRYNAMRLSPFILNIGHSVR